MVESRRETHNYQPINSYGVIGDCHSVALIAPDGAVDWGCFPDFDSPAIFCRLLDAEQGGYFQIVPTDRSLAGTQRYVSGTNVLETRFTGTTGEILLTDFMPVETLRTWPYPTIENDQSGMGSHQCLVRRLECVAGELSITMILKVTPNYAAAPVEIALIQAPVGALISSYEQHVSLAVIGTEHIPSYSMSVTQEEGDRYPSIVAQLTLHQGETVFFIVGVESSFRAVQSLVEEEFLQRNFDRELEHTVVCWRQWIAGQVYRGPYVEWVERSALVLKMLTYAPTGAIVAAPTTSLPESIGADRNWDYRFSWLRDATFTLYALNMLGLMGETRGYIHWLSHLSLSDKHALQIMYGIRGERDLSEQELHHLAGYRGSAPVRIGNGAAKQKQLDVFGEILDCIYFYQRQGGFERHGEKLEDDLWEILSGLVEYVCDHWQETDSGIWEVRSGPQHFIYSKVMCWVALDRGIRLAEKYKFRAALPRWRRVCNQIYLDVLSHGYNPEIGAFTRSYEDTAIDASNLVLPLVGFIAPNHVMMRSTVERTIEQLTDKNGMVYRYHAEDGFSSSEGTFTICTFWLIDNLAMQGRIEEAKRLFEQLLDYAGPLGLFSEGVESDSRLAIGNYPQAFTHIGLINSVMNLQRAEKHFRW